MTVENPILPIQATQSQDTTPPITQAAAYQAVESQAVQSGAPVASKPESASISTMNELREQEPKLYRMMMESIGWRMKHQMDNVAKRAKEIRKEYERGA